MKPLFSMVVAILLAIAANAQLDTSSRLPVGCPAALKCTPIEFCTAKGVVSNTTVTLTKKQELYRVPITDCKDPETGRIGKCCKDPFYVDPWPVDVIGFWRPKFNQTKTRVVVREESLYNEYRWKLILKRYVGSGKCGILNPQKPYGDHKELEVDFAEIPWQAMVLLQTNRSLLCGGVITRPDVVITSASCVKKLEAKNVLIKAGEWKLGVDDEPLPFQIVQVKDILRHPLYKDGVYKYDTAILVLAEDLHLAKNIWPICLPSANETVDVLYNETQKCIVTGWGKEVLQAHRSGSIMHSLNISLIKPEKCEARLSKDYRHLLKQYDRNNFTCGQPTKPLDDLCKADTGSPLACTTGDGYYVLRGIYSWDTGCQVGNQLAALYKFDVEWYEWAIGLKTSVQFAEYDEYIKSKATSSSKITYGSDGKVISNITIYTNETKITQRGPFGTSLSSGIQRPISKKFSKTVSETKTFISKPTFSTTYTEKKIFQSEPKFITYTTKPEIVTFTSKPQYYTYSSKPKIITFKPQIVKSITSGTKSNPTNVARGVNFKPF